MIWLLIPLAVLAPVALAALCGAGFYKFESRDVISVCFLGLGVLVLVVGWVGLGVLANRQLTHHFDKLHCATYAEETGYETRYIDVALFDYGCYVNSNGRWIPQDKVWTTPGGES